MKKIVIFTGDETRHIYFRKRLSNDPRFEVIASFCEGTEASLAARTFANENSTELEKLHVIARARAEHDFFSEPAAMYEDKSHPRKLKRGEINSPEVVQQISELVPDLLVCYGSSLIKTELLKLFAGRFLNVHLGLSPYYRGSGTNVWALINNEPHMVGATFMHIDAGIDTGKIIHQIRAEIVLGDSSHSIGNRLIRAMTQTYADIIANVDHLTDEVQPKSEGALYKMKDFDGAACAKLYAQLGNGMIERYLDHIDKIDKPYIVQNKGLESRS
jgi:folate-dependent phosphoribosylglycinamide formyltransferase PurN